MPDTARARANWLMSESPFSSETPQLIQLQDNIGITTISKPPANPLSEAVVASLLAAFDQFEQQQARVIIIRGDPRCKIWSAGHDVKEMPVDGQDPVTWNTGFERLLHRVRHCPVPVIAMIDGSVWGGACDLAVTCDLVVGTPKATFAITPVKMGIAYNTGGLSHFMGTLPLHIVKEMLFTGEPLSAEDAHRFGLLNRLVSSEQLPPTTMALAKVIASRAPLAVSVLKTELRGLTAGADLSADEFEQIQYSRRLAFRSEDFKEGVRAFFEKRAPVFKGK